MTSHSKLMVGSTYLVKWKDTIREGKILEQRKIANSEELEYYVHFLDFDKRLDSWLTIEQFDSDQPKSPVNEIPVEVQKTEAEEEQKVAMQKKAQQYYTEDLSHVRNIESIVFNDYVISTWYFSPYPEEYGTCKQLYICPYCLKYMKLNSSLDSHQPSCTFRHPPGILIYQKEKTRIYEVDGKIHKLYCQNLCLLAKLFLDHKALYYDVEPFQFYILTEMQKKKNEDGQHFERVIGYFSKEKKSVEGNNLACILVFPQYQRKGYGRLLIEFSYELSKIEKKIGAPERPLSDLGLMGYRSYWGAAILRILLDQDGLLNIQELSNSTCIRPTDIILTLKYLGLVKYWKEQTTLCITKKSLQECLKRFPLRLSNTVEPSSIIWSPTTHE
ncbi:HAM group protein [Basidiobolus meristosporus CBS 931.73]|uniref:histone acetyltransferase n=1 Tax=Basidiobolus meristosporus CBS 931.73 TaxID=1314790 RepID=A0A1Y1ZAS3_9FUNG|nr:HAM group protein [Basidiobolus meristosporus CBS 931.73]|eukprot:ORY07097.1 HAM group protein [Basidiobolus meristosporus CBS 931.73]